MPDMFDHYKQLSSWGKETTDRRVAKPDKRNITYKEYCIRCESIGIKPMTATEWRKNNQ